ncbi:hypothetical protein EDC22_10972 [Tepidamorphus gemmatus]|uniref:Uncharacterized protein n=1 Tax=Tepidamorphus gemmatus TaxID=747076 RepID=A0A4R3M618_9HYPH|nr:DUF5993 family protein [Tepidamorphus gemmatus]TCT08396.1 hypothetical protein EDC22_10972 [Tepidamorphus gemmatus]
MMALPFLTAFLALLGGAFASRAIGIALWAVTLVLILVLFRLHATDPLDIVL